MSKYITACFYEYVLKLQLYDLDKQIGLEAVDILDEACQEESFLEAVVLQQPQLPHLGEKGASLLTRFFSVKRGYSLMSRLGYIDRAIEMWFKVSVCVRWCVKWKETIHLHCKFLYQESN